MAFETPANYGTGQNSTIGTQFRTDFYNRKALEEAAKEKYFGQLADVTTMPKHFGKTIKLYHYMPLLDDRNVNDQGIDATGAVIADGNLYGSSKDVGTIAGKLPAVGEHGGRVNRVGYKRIDLQGTIEKFGFFDEYTHESVIFDTDEELMEHRSREMILGANEITEDALQIDLLNGAGVVYYAGTATADNEVSGEDGAADEVTYADLVRLGIELDDNRTPKQTKVITGVRMIDTKVISGGRVMYVGTELLPTLMKMKDFHGERAFVEVKHYAANGTTLRGEEGSIAGFRIVVVPEMMKWEGAGATESNNGGFHATDGKYDVFPMLVVGDKSFTTIGFETDGKTTKFKMKHVKPGEVMHRDDPYGETGFNSIKWWYGSMILRSERLALIKTVASL